MGDVIAEEKKRERSSQSLGATRAVKGEHVDPHGIPGLLVAEPRMGKESRSSSIFGSSAELHLGKPPGLFVAECPRHQPRSKV